MNDNSRRAPVQGEGAYWCGPSNDVWKAMPPPKPPGTIAWWEHLEAHVDYERRYPDLQTAEKIAERGGFGYEELVFHLGHKPTTWKERE